MSLVRVTSQLLNRHERRRWHIGNLPPVDGDILRSLAHWRRARGCEHGLHQYVAHRAVALGGYPLSRLRMIEAAIRCDVTCREAVQAFRRAAA